MGNNLRSMTNLDESQLAVPFFGQSFDSFANPPIGSTTVLAHDHFSFFGQTLQEPLMNQAINIGQGVRYNGPHAWDVHFFHSSVGSTGSISADPVFNPLAPAMTKSRTLEQILGRGSLLDVMTRSTFQPVSNGGFSDIRSRS